MKYYNKVNKNINCEKIMSLCDKMSWKILKVCYSKDSGNKFLIEGLELKNDLIEELKATCYLAIFENGFSLDNKLYIKKRCFNLKNKMDFKYLNKKAVCSTLNYFKNKYKKIEKNKEFSLEEESEENAKKLDKISYQLYNSKIYEIKKNDRKISIELLGLTERQKEILLIYAKTKSYQKTADLLGIGKTTVLKTVQRIREKAR